MKSFSALALSFLMACAVGAQETTGPEVIPNRYIITLKAESADLASHLKWLETLSNDGEGVLHKFEIGTSFIAYAGEFSDSVIEAIKENDDVAHVEEETLMKPAAAIPQAPDNANTICTGIRRLNQTKSAGEWGLGRVSHYDTIGEAIDPVNPGHPTYNFRLAGMCGGMTAYVVDTGIDLAHPEFQGRARFGWKANDTWSDSDEMGHGTAVASVIAGARLGVHATASIVAVKVFGPADDPSGGTDGMAYVMAGIAWATNDAVAGNRAARSVINISIAGWYSLALNDLVKAAYEAGVTIVTGAGNAPVDACNLSPGSSRHGINVAAVDVNDTLMFFSSVSCCVDIFAPGVDVKTAAPGGETLVQTGSSFAAPHVAGMVLYNKCLHGYTTPAEDKFGVTDDQFVIKDKVQGGICVGDDKPECVPGPFGDSTVGGGCSKNKIVYNRGCPSLASS